jgi:cephalosporin hydroxylase
MYTYEEFEKLRIERAAEMAADSELRQKALDVLVAADHYNWIHQTTWLGQPCLNLPQDLFALQEIIFKTRPQFIIESGVAWGGSLLFYSTLMQILGGQGIIGIDIYIPPDLTERLNDYGSLSEKITLIEASSTDADTVDRVRAIVGDTRDVMVVLDSNHAHDHVYKELLAYAPFIGKGHYLVCSDTVVEDIPPQTHRPRPWGPGNNPQTALNQFLEENDAFAVDKTLENKLLFTCNPRGYLIRVKD